MIIRIFMAMVMAAGVFWTGTSHANTISFDLNFEFSGGTAPAGSAPWIRATFDDGGTPGSVTLTIDLLGLTGSEFITAGGISFNLDPLLDVSNLAFAHVSGDTAVAVNTGTNAFKADGDGYFDFRFTYETANTAGRFGAGETSVYDITSSDAITAASFDFSSVQGGGNGTYTAAAHVGGIGQYSTSGWIGPSAIPLPAAFWLFGSGLVGLLGLARHRR